MGGGRANQRAGGGVNGGGIGDWLACVLEDEVALADFGAQRFDEGVGIVGAVEQGENGLLHDVEGDVFVARVGGPGASGTGVGAGDVERAGAIVEGRLRRERNGRDFSHADQEHLE